MPPQIVLIRHAQALHNVENKSPSFLGSVARIILTNAAVSAQDYYLHDPPLTELGESQCQPLRDSLIQRFGNIPVQDVAVIVSPMLRTLQTASLALDWLVEKGVRFEANADWQENSSKPCDTGGPVGGFTQTFPHVDFSTLDPIWPDKTSQSARRYAYSRASIIERGRLCLEALHNRPEKLIFVVSHSGFMRVGVVGWWFFNSDYRVFDFVQGLDSDGRRMVKQHETTLEGGLGLSRTERVALGDDLPEEDPSIAPEA